MSRSLVDRSRCMVDRSRSRLVILLMSRSMVDRSRGWSRLEMLLRSRSRLDIPLVSSLNSWSSWCCRSNISFALLPQFPVIIGSMVSCGVVNILSSVALLSQNRGHCNICKKDKPGHVIVVVLVDVVVVIVVEGELTLYPTPITVN